MDTARLILGAMRLGVGLGGWFAPDRSARFFGIEPAHADRFVTRLFASRDLALAGTLLAARDGTARPLAAVNVGVDAIDAIAGADEYRRGNLSTRALVLGPGGALLLAALGLLAHREASAK